MADKKISELTALTGANVATDDQLVIVDTSAALTKSITIDEFKNALDTATGFVRITGDTMTGNLSMSGANITLGDSSGASDDRIVLGDDSDLLIYHNNPNSFISEAGNGSLFITTDGNYIILSKADASTYLATFQPDGPVTLYNSGSAKLSTTSTGVDITGTLTSDGLTVGDGHTIGNDGSDNLEIKSSSGENLLLKTGGSVIQLYNSSDVRYFRLDSNGDISFYEDTGTTAKLHWSAADESLGIGDTSPLAPLFVNGNETNTTDLTAVLWARSKTGASIPQLNVQGDQWQFGGGGTLDTSPTMTIDYGSNAVGIGTDSPSYAIDTLSSGSVVAQFKRDATGGGSGGIRFGNNDKQFTLYGDNSNGLTIYDGTSERMRIDSSGNVGIGTDSPATTLDVRGIITMDPKSDATNPRLVFDHDNFTGASFIEVDRGDNAMEFWNQGSERMRIDSSGSLLVGTTSGATNSPGIKLYNAGGTLASSNWVKTLTGTHNAIRFYHNGANVGNIQYSDTATSYLTSSDYRLKENVVELTNATDRLKQIPVHRFNFIADADTTVDGFLAHEVQTVVPEAVSGTHNEVDADGNPVYQGIDQSKLVPLLVATIKELEARITALENA